MSELELIGAGFGRTGTSSLMAALNQLGYKTHHMLHVFELSQAKKWQDIHAGKNIEVWFTNFYRYLDIHTSR